MIGVVIQARMGSTRLPGKVLKPIGGIPLLERIILSLKHSSHTFQVVVATSDLERDDCLVSFCREKGFDVFRGSEQNVLQRYCECAEQHGFSHVIRLTGDNPFTDVVELDRLLALHLDQAADYSTSIAVLPMGVGAEIFSMEALRKIHARASEPHHYEHVNDYLLENPDQFKVVELEVPAGKNMPGVRLTVDTPEDYRRADDIARAIPSIPVPTEQAISLALRYAS